MFYLILRITIFFNCSTLTEITPNFVRQKNTTQQSSIFLQQLRLFYVEHHYIIYCSVDSVAVTDLNLIIFCWNISAKYYIYPLEKRGGRLFIYWDKEDEDDWVKTKEPIWRRNLWRDRKNRSNISLIRSIIM